MNEIYLEIKGEPQGKQRARFFRAGHFMKSYTPKETVNYETYIRELFCIAYPGFEPLREALAVNIMSYCRIPPSESRKKQDAMKAGFIRPAKKPEIDNILKVVLDALTGLAWLNDKQVVDTDVHKWYSYVPRVEVRISIAGADPNFTLRR